MREAAFVEKNELKWKKFESFVNGDIRLTPDELASYYTDIIDDLSYAKTFYPKSKLVRYLNRLSSKAHQRIYVTKKEDRKRFRTFWTEEIPLAIRASHKELFHSFLVFVIAIAIGAVSTYISEDFPRMILGDSYVDMTIDNIEKGDPMGVYRDNDKAGMFMAIGSNNVRVGLISFVLGLLGAIFAGIVLVGNGIMVGAFQGFFVKYGLFWITFSTIFLHGALELSAIVIFAASGMIIGNAWWYPGTYSRMDAILQAGKNSIKVLLAVIPVIIAAAIIESYVTYQYQEMNSIVRGSIIFISFAYIIWYFIIYPIQVEKKLANHDA